MIIRPQLQFDDTRDDAAPAGATVTNLTQVNAYLALQTASSRIAWALEYLPGAHAVSSSFGAQSALLLHMSNIVLPGIPVIFVDTGFLFPETYEFAELLTARLDLNVVRAQPASAARWPEAQVANLQQAGLAAITRYNHAHKVEPMQRALAQQQVQTWIAGLRRSQSDSRRDVQFLQTQNGRLKLHCIADWTDRDIGRYLAEHDLPYHPLWEKGYVSIGDRYLTTPLVPGMRSEDARFFGLKRECGLHG
jgi:phosphoadenosine phosphosulfate reductase